MDVTAALTTTSLHESKDSIIAAVTTARVVHEASVADALLECKDNMCNTSCSVVKLKFVSLPLDYTLIPKKDKLHFEDVLAEDLNDHKKVGPYPFICVTVYGKCLLNQMYTISLPHAEVRAIWPSMLPGWVHQLTQA